MMMMMPRKMKKIKVDALVYGPVSVWYDDYLEEYQVRVQGLPDATYYTTDRKDAIATAQAMCTRPSMEDAE